MNESNSEKQSYHISVSGFEPKTAKKGKETTERKRELRNEFALQNNNLAEIRSNCKGKQLSVDVWFYLYYGVPKDVSRYKKDLDNMLKVLLDVLKEKMDDNLQVQGLGIINDNEDNLIYEINCRKTFVNLQSQEGIHVTISEYVQDGR
jgi:Holliday junction resolvase RusA-like endonuclease